MAISLLVLLVPVLLLFAAYQAVSGRNQPVEVDPGPALAAARDAGVQAVEPSGLGTGWVPVSAVFQPAGAAGTLRIGYVTPAGGSAQVVQSTVPAERLLPAELPGAVRPAARVDVAGRAWQLHPPDGGVRALVLLEPELTTIVVGSVAEDELRVLAAALP
jgi:hypothetical protein